VLKCRTLSRVAVLAAVVSMGGVALGFAGEAPANGMKSVEVAQKADSGLIDMSAYLKERRTTNHPNPWPLRNLIKPGTLTVGITAKSPPGSFTNKKGEFDGSRIQLWKIMAKDLGLKLEFVRLDWPGILPGLAANKFDMACEGASWSNTRLKSPDFLLTRPIVTNASIGIVRKDSGIKSWKDADGKRLGGVRGEHYYVKAKSVVKGPSGLVDMPGRPEAVLALLNKQMDVFAVDMNKGRQLLVDHPRSSELMMIGPPLDLLLGGMCVNKREPALLMAANLLLTNYRVDGTIAKLEMEYYGTDLHVRLLEMAGY
jgi:ABC-type amino acid transport substrate-binding protein